MSYGANRRIAGGARHRTYKRSGDARAVKAEYYPSQEGDPRGSLAERDCNDYSAEERPEDDHADRTLMNSRKQSGAASVYLCS